MTLIRLLQSIGCLSLLTSVILSSAVASSTDAPSASVNWQKVDLQQKLQTDLGRVLTSLVGADHYVLSIDIKLKKSVIKPTVAAQPKLDAGDVNDQSFPLSKIGLTAHSVDGEWSADSVKGLEPEMADIFNVIDKVHVTCLLDNSVDSSRRDIIKKVIASQLTQFATKDVEIAIEKVQLLAPVKEDVREPASKDDKNPKADLKDAKDPKDSKDLKDSKDGKDGKNGQTAEAPSFGDKFEPFKYPVTIFLSFLTVMAMMLVFSRKSQVPAATAAGAEPAQPPKNASAQEESHSAAPTSAASVTPASSMHSSNHGSSNEPTFETEEVKLTVDKFKILLKTNRAKSSLLLLEWVNSENAAARGALKALVLHLSLDEFSSVTAGFDASQKKSFKRAMNADASGASTSEAMNFLRSQLLSSILEDDLEINEQQRGFLSTVKAQEVADLAKSAPELAAGLLNLIPPDLVAQTLNLLDSESVSRVLSLAVQFKVSEALAQFGAFETKVMGLRESSKVNLAPVLEGAETLLGQVTSENESHLFSALLASKAYAMVEDLSKKYFPSELVLQFEPSNLNSILMRMPLTARAELIFSRQETEREIIFKAFGDSAKLREMIDSEIEGIQTDEARKRRVEANREMIWKQFVGSVRDAVRTNPVVQGNADDLLKTWIDSKKPEAVSLSVAA